MKINARPILTADFILSKVSQEDIFEQVLGIKVVHRKLFVNPYRQDRFPTCTFAYKGKVLLFRDWADSAAINCFSAVQKYKNLPNFYETLLHIYNYFHIEGAASAAEHLNITSNTDYKSQKEKLEIEVQNFSKTDKEYFAQYGISIETLKKFHVYSVYKYWTFGELNYVYSNKNPCVGYYLGKSENGEDRWKLYFYKNKALRFKNNTNRIQGLPQIPPNGKLLIITKSLKDVMVLSELGYISIAPPSENFIIYPSIIQELKQRFKKVILFYDNDAPGKRLGAERSITYNIPVIYLPENTAKDISDYAKAFSLEQAGEIMKQLITNL